MKQTFFFYDLETSGLKPREDRLMQFAGQRTDMDLNPIGEPVNILIKITTDALPSPQAISVTGITPQKTLEEGVTEAEFCRLATEEIFTPGTCALGYNTVRFDDEFMRALFWRNFYDPYEWEWKDRRSRWDMLDVVRLTRALRSEGVNWPFTSEGKPTNRLELLTKCNGLSHEHAHDALSDVYATIAVAQMIKEKQPKLFRFLYENRGKREIMQMVNLESPCPVVYASGRYENKYNKTTVVVPIAPGRNGNVLVYDLRYNLEEILAKKDGDLEEDLTGNDNNSKVEQNETSETSKNAVGITKKEVSQNKKLSYYKSKFFPLVKELCYNKCPAVAPLVVLNEQDGWEKIGLSKEQVNENWRILRKHPEFIEEMRGENEKRPEFPPAIEPEQALYDGFLNDGDRLKVEAVRNAELDKLADFHPYFSDERLPELLLHFKGRNYPESLSETESQQWEKYRLERLKRQVPKFLAELAGVEDDFLKEELKLYLESLATI